MSREAKHRAPEPIELQQQDPDYVDTQSRSRGEVSLSAPFDYPIGALVGTVVLPPPPGVIYTDQERAEQRRHLSVHIFNLPDAEATGRHAVPEGRYLLASSEALGHLGSIATGQKPETPIEGEGLVTMSEGSVLQVGREHWLPSLGTAVVLQEMDTKLQRIYSGVSREHGVFRMQDGELTWEDHSKNGSSFVHAPNSDPENSADPSFLATQRAVAPERQPEIASVFDTGAVEAMLQVYDEPTGQPPNWPS